MTTWVKKLADWDVRLASQKNISPSVQTWALFSIQQGRREGPTVAPTNGWAGLLMVADCGCSLTVTCLGEGPTVAPTNDWVGPLWLVSASLLLHPKQKGTTAESSQVWTSTQLVSNIILQPTVQGVRWQRPLVAMWRWLDSPSTRTTVWDEWALWPGHFAGHTSQPVTPRQPQSWCPRSGLPPGCLCSGSQPAWWAESRPEWRRAAEQPLPRRS